jgi:hypothetical protein
MLLPESGYGSRNPSTQVLNCHIFDHFKKNISLEEWENDYSCYNANRSHIEKFYNFIKNEDVTFITFPRNNTELMNEILARHNIKINNTKMLRCGLSSVAKMIENNVKPFLVGYSLNTEHTIEHSYNNENFINKSFHCDETEIKIIKSLHDLKLIDATFCCINDEKKLSLNDNLSHTEESTQILKEIYGYS